MWSGFISKYHPSPTPPHKRLVFCPVFQGTTQITRRRRRHARTHTFAHTQIGYILNKLLVPYPGTSSAGVIGANSHMVKLTLRGRQLVGGFYGAEKRQSEKNYFPLQKLMIMSSYLMDSNYIDPKFPPCEEYSQNNYIPDHSPEYYSRTRESSFQHHHQDLYPPPPPQRPSYPERQYSCASLQGPGNPPAHQRGHGQAPGGHHLPEKPQQLCDQTALASTATSPSPAPPACNQQNPEHPSSTATKQPIVYPWMKKIHVSTGRQLFSSPLSLSLCFPPPPPSHHALSFFPISSFAFNESLWVSTIELDLRLRVGNYTHHKFYSQASLGSPSHVVRSVMYVWNSKGFARGA